MYFRCISLYPNGEDVENISHISLFLTRNDSLSIPFQVDFKITLGKKKESIVQEIDTKSSDDLKEGFGFGWDDFISHEKFQKYEDDYVEDNKLKITCEVKT